MVGILDPSSWISGFPQNFRNLYKSAKIEQKLIKTNKGTLILICAKNIKVTVRKVNCLHFKKRIFHFLKKLPVKDWLPW